MRGSARYLFELSLEHSDFPYNELAAVSERLGDKCTRKSKRICIVESPRTGVEMRTYGETLAFCLKISSLHGEYSDWEDLKRGVEDVASAARSGTACVRVASDNEDIRRMKPELERELGGLVSRYCTIRLDKPETEVRIVAEAGVFFLATKIMDVDRRAIDSRHVKHRAFFSPVSLSPRYARGLLNLCGVTRGKRVLDPFCGTGGIVIESVLLGADTAGSDIDPLMIEGTMKNLEQLGLASGCELRCMDVGRIGEFGTFDAVVTDPPYGRSSFYNKEDIGKLYMRYLVAAERCLREGGTIGIVVPDIKLLPEIEGLEIRVHIVQRVHKSLVRNYVVLGRQARGPKSS